MSESERAARSIRKRRVEPRGERTRLPAWSWVAIGAGSTLLIGAVAVGATTTLVAPRVLDGFGRTQRDRTQRDLDAIESALEQFARLNAGRYPDSLEPLVTPDANGQTFLEEQRLPRDAWGRVYHYERPGSAGARPRLYTLGRDGTPGGAGEDADFYNSKPR